MPAMSTLIEVGSKTDTVMIEGGDIVTEVLETTSGTTMDVATTDEEIASGTNVEEVDKVVVNCTRIDGEI